MNMARGIVAAGTVVTLAACGGGGSSGAAMIGVHGAVGWSLASTCQELSLVGAPVKITDSSGTVLATTYLPVRPWSGTVHGLTGVNFTFSAMVPPEPRYGVSIGSISPFYVTQEQFVEGIYLTC
jgi:hypothetical protein